MNTPPQRMTRQRSVILEQLQAMHSHPTADELYDVVRRQLPSVSLGTIYRNLDVLTKSGQVRKLDSGAGHARFDGDISSHHHVRCRVCGRVDDVRVTKDMRFSPPECSEHGFQIENYRVEFDGRCPDCSEADGALLTEPTG